MSDEAVSLSEMIDELPGDLDEQKFSDFIECLFRGDDRAGLVLLLASLVRSAVSAWRRTERASKDEVIEARNRSLLPSIRGIGRVCVDAIRFGYPMVHHEGVEGLGRIYNLARFKNLGLQHGDPELSWSTPAQAALTQLYVIGSYATFRHRMRYIRPILDERVDQPDASLTSCVSPLTHPHADPRLRRHRLVAHFKDAASLIRANESLFSLFFNDEERVTNTLSQFDFIVTYALYRRGEQISYPNFCRYYRHRVMPVIERLLERKSYSALFGSFEPQQFAGFLHEVGSMCARRAGEVNQWDVGQWTTSVREFLESYPLEEA